MSIYVNMKAMTIWRRLNKTLKFTQFSLAFQKPSVTKQFLGRQKNLLVFGAVLIPHC